MTCHEIIAVTSKQDCHFAQVTRISGIYKNTEPKGHQWNWSSVTPLPMAAVLLTPPVTIFCSSST